MLWFGDFDEVDFVAAHAKISSLLAIASSLGDEFVVNVWGAIVHTPGFDLEYLTFIIPSIALCRLLLGGLTTRGIMEIGLAASTGDPYDLTDGEFFVRLDFAWRRMAPKDCEFARAFAEDLADAMILIPTAKLTVVHERLERI